MYFRSSWICAAACVLIAISANAATSTWTGSSSANWSDSANWTPVGVPQAGDSLQFPDAGLHRDMVNDLPAGRAFADLAFDSGYTLSGNAFTLTHSIVGRGTMVQAPIETLANDVSMTLAT